ncbi:MAG: ABC transporter permease [Chloroflexia bacterium]|nr:ABC transporter permease [Chloroflexia bacterium]
MVTNESQIVDEESAVPGAQARTLGEAEERGGLPIPAWLKIIWQNGKARVGLVMLAFFVIVAVFAPLIAPHDPRNNDFVPFSEPSAAHLLGTTQAGEDIFSQFIYATRTSLIVGVLAGGLATIIGLVIGMIAGYAGGAVDEVLNFIINLALVIPLLPLMIVIAAYSPIKGLVTVIIVIGITSWAGGARLKRSQMISLKERDYITASLFAGDSMWRIVFKEIMPNMTSLIVVGFLGAATGAIGAESGLSFIGVGDPLTISWGTMMLWANNSGALLGGQWWWLFPPGIALALLITSLVFINFGIDAISNPHLREE